MPKSYAQNTNRCFAVYFQFFDDLGVCLGGGRFSYDKKNFEK